MATADKGAAQPHSTLTVRAAFLPLRRVCAWLSWWLTGDIHHQQIQAILIGLNDKQVALQKRVVHLEAGLDSLGKIVAEGLADSASRDDLVHSLLSMEQRSFNQRLVALETKPQPLRPPEREAPNPAAGWTQVKSRASALAIKEEALEAESV